MLRRYRVNNSRNLIYFLVLLVALGVPYGSYSLYKSRDQITHSSIPRGRQLPEEFKNIPPIPDKWKAYENDTARFRLRYPNEIDNVEWNVVTQNVESNVETVSFGPRNTSIQPSLQQGTFVILIRKISARQNKKWLLENDLISIHDDIYTSNSKEPYAYDLAYDITSNRILRAFMERKRRLVVMPSPFETSYRIYDISISNMNPSLDIEFSIFVKSYESLIL